MKAACPLTLLALLALLWAAPAAAEGWTCQVREELSPNLPADTGMSVGVPGRQPIRSFSISWVPQRGHIAE